MLFDHVHERDEVRRLSEGELLLVRAANGDKVAVTKADGAYYAVGDRCPHFGCSLSKGATEGAVLTCHCHGSKFDVRSGAVVKGPARNGVRTYSVAVTDAGVTIELVEEQHAI